MNIYFHIFSLLLCNLKNNSNNVGSINIGVINVSMTIYEYWSEKPGENQKQERADILLAGELKQLSISQHLIPFYYCRLVIYVIARPESKVPSTNYRIKTNIKK